MQARPDRHGPQHAPESANPAVSWLAKQLVWEQRLSELRGREMPAPQHQAA